MALAGVHTRRERRNRPLDEVKTKKKSGGLAIPRIRIRGIALYVILVLAVVMLLLVASGFQANQTCRDIQVSIDAGNGQGFLNMVDVKKIIGLDYGREIIGEKMNKIDLIGVESALNESPFIKNAEVYKSVKGMLQVDVELRTAVARLMNNDGSALYMDADGVRFPTSGRYSANVVLVRGDFNESLAESDTAECGSIVDIAVPVIQFIHTHEFWNAMISEVVIRKNGELLLHPRIGKMEVEFGNAVRIEDKFENLRLFYQQVVKTVGWDKYRRVSVKYKGQVIGKK